MTDPLWLWDALVKAAGGRGDGTPQGPITGFSIDTRTIESGDVFVALKDQRDGHEFVSKAFEAGAAAAIVSHDYERASDDGALLRVGDPLGALENIGRAARARLAPDAHVVAVTGSAGKTTTKEMLRACFAPFGAVHASEKSYNNHWGVPLTLARMPATTRFGVFEIGMNHPGEITPLTKMVRPHVAVITTVAPAHLGHFKSEEEIAEAKAEIFAGLAAGEGFAVLPRDNPHFALLAQRACEALGETMENVLGDESMLIYTFGESGEAGLHIKQMQLTPERSIAAVDLGDLRLRAEIGVPGRHNVLNAAACLYAWLLSAGTEARDEHDLDAMIDEALAALKDLRLEPAGRGQVHEIGGVTLVDESYNANPASMAAALETLALYPRKRRRIAIVGDMLELGEEAPRLHREVSQPISAAGIDVVFACGPHMAQLFDEIPEDKRGGYAPTSAELEPMVLEGVRQGDCVMVKGSLGSKMGRIVDALKRRLTSGH